MHGSTTLSDCQYPVRAHICTCHYLAHAINKRCLRASLRRIIAFSLAGRAGQQRVPSCWRRQGWSVSRRQELPDRSFFLAPRSAYCLLTLLPLRLHAKGCGRFEIFFVNRKASTFRSRLCLQSEGPQDPLLLSDETKELDPPSPLGKRFMI